MRFNADTAYKELRPHFQERVRRNEPLARHCTFGVGGPADVWISLETREELIGLVRLCVAKHWPLLIAGNSTNVLYADDGVRGIVARVALNTYSIEDHGDGTALLIADAGVKLHFEPLVGTRFDPLTVYSLVLVIRPGIPEFVQLEALLFQASYVRPYTLSVASLTVLKGVANCI